MNIAVRPISLAQLIALNDELHALVRAGVPLERGLAALSSEERGRVGALARALGERMQQGESWQGLLADETSPLPPLYRAVLEAGLRSGRLGDALSGLADTLRRMQEVRRLTWSALTYPLTVLALAYGLLLYALRGFVPQLIETCDGFGIPRSWGLQLVAAMHATVGVWWWIPPLIVGLLLTGQMWQLRRLAYSGTPRAWFPLARVVRSSSLTTYARFVAILLEHQTPLARALTLAGEASGDAALRRASYAAAAELERGGPPQTIAGLPPLLAYTLSAPLPQQERIAALARLARDYHRRAQRDIAWLTQWLPVWLTLFIGGGAVLFQAALLVGPWLQLMYQMTLPE